VRWIAANIKKEGKKVTGQTVKHFLSKVGTDMENIQKELEKLFCYTLDKEIITTEDVEEICTTQITNQIFAMVDSVANKQQRKALDYYYDLIALKEPPMRILYLLVRQFKLLLEVKELDKRGYAKKDIATMAGIMPFVVGKYQEQAKTFRRSMLREIIEYGVELEESVKTGHLNDTLAVELFIMKYSAK
jgi:DNA polymerase-3 subunit delta